MRYASCWSSSSVPVSQVPEPYLRHWQRHSRLVLRALSLGGCYLGVACSSSPSSWVLGSAPHLTTVRFGLILLMNSEPWYGLRIPVRRLGTLHGFEAGEDLLSGPPGGVDSLPHSWARPRPFLRRKSFHAGLVAKASRSVRNNKLLLFLDGGLSLPLRGDRW
jgi:hypothetical protein